MKNLTYQELISKLDSFIKKYYLNQIIRGLIISVIILSVLIIFISFSEYYGHFSIPVRTIMFYSLLGLLAATFIYFIVIPGLKYLKIGKIISYQQASQIISQHFKDIKDQLFNILELVHLSHSDRFSAELVLASIEQKTKRIKPVPFNNAINFKKNFKYVRILIILLLLTGLVSFITPEIFTEGSYRVLKHKTYFEPKAPFRFILLNDSLNVLKGNEIEIKTKVEGDFIPHTVYISYGGNNFIMKKEKNNIFSYEFRELNNPLSFYLHAQNVRSQPFDINIMPNPVVNNFTIDVQVPNYISEQDLHFTNVGDISVPYGSKVSWNFLTKDIDTLVLIFNQRNNLVAKKDSNTFFVQQTFYESSNYRLFVGNQFVVDTNFMRYAIDVVPDLYPDISAEQVQDSTNLSLYYLRGIINDDYGFNKLEFKVHIIADNDTTKTYRYPISINKQLVNQEFYHFYDFSEIDFKPGEEIHYYFEIFDNDVLHNYKSSRSKIFEFKVPTEEELQNLAEQTNQSVQEKLKTGNEMVNELKDDLSDIHENTVNKKSSTWENEQKLKDLMKKQNTLQDLVKQLKQENLEKNQRNNTFSQQKKDILKKQKQIQELLDKLLDDELKDLIKQIQELQKNLDKKNAEKLFEDIKLSYDDLSEQLDKNLELLKKLEVEEQIQNSIDKMKDLSIEQKNLAEQTEYKKSDKEVVKEKQKGDADDFEKAVDNYKKAMEKNKELENPLRLDNFEKDIEDIRNTFKETKENLNKGKNRKASQNQKNNSNKLNDLAKSMENMMQSNQAMTLQQNMDDLRQILDNLVTFSFDQEELIDELNDIHIKDPKYMDIVNEQKKLTDNFVVIKDSLYSLAKNAPQINNMVNKEILRITRQLGYTLEDMEERHKQQAQSKQQIIMTSSNNLALLLSEILDNISNMKGGSGNSNMPQKSKKGQQPSISKLRQQQQSIKSQLEQMLKQMKEGQKPGEGKKSMSKSLAKTLAQQEIFEQMLNELMQKGGLNNATQQKLRETKELIEQSKKEISNKLVTPDLLNRQNEIITRLLEAEKAEKEREIEKKRESKEAKVTKLSNPEKIFPYKEKDKSFNELLQKSSIRMNSFYKDKYRTYLLNLNQE